VFGERVSNPLASLAPLKSAVTPEKPLTSCKLMYLHFTEKAKCCESLVPLPVTTSCAVAACPLSRGAAGSHWLLRGGGWLPRAEPCLRPLQNLEEDSPF